MESVGVNRAVVVQMTTQIEPLLFVLERFPRKFSGVATLPPRRRGLGSMMKDLKQKRVRGFRVYDRPEQPLSEWLKDKSLEQMCIAAALNNQVICFWVGPNAFSTIGELCDRHPETKFVIDHMGGVGFGPFGDPSPAALDGLLALGTHGNAHLKCSAPYAFCGKAGARGDFSVLTSNIYMMAQAFEDRFMWGSDNPFLDLYGDPECNYASWHGFVDSIFPRSRARSVFRTAAERLFFAG